MSSGPSPVVSGNCWEFAAAASGPSTPRWVLIRATHLPPATCAAIPAIRRMSATPSARLNRRLRRGEWLASTGALLFGVMIREAVPAPREAAGAGAAEAAEAGAEALEA